MDKRVAVVTGDLIHDLVIRPGTTAGDVIRQLDLPSDYKLAKRDKEQFGHNEEIYGSLREGEKVFANPEAIVGN